MSHLRIFHSVHMLANTNNDCCFQEEERKIFNEHSFYLLHACSRLLSRRSKILWCSRSMCLILLADIGEVPQHIGELCSAFNLEVQYEFSSHFCRLRIAIKRTDNKYLLINGGVSVSI